MQAVLSAGVQSVQEFLTWFFLAHGGMSEGLWRREGASLFTTLPVAWTATVLPVYEGLRLRLLLSGQVCPDRLPAQLALIALGLGVGLTMLRILHRPSLLRGRGFLVAALWFGLPGLAVAWFDPAEVKLWLIPVLGLWISAGLVLSSWDLPGRTRRCVASWLACLVVLIAMGNFLVPVWANHRVVSRELTVARDSLHFLGPHDLVVSAGFDWTAHLSYLSAEAPVFNAVAVAQFRGRQSVKGLLDDRMERAWEQGGQVYILDYFGPGQAEVWEDWITPFTGLTPGDFRGYRLDRAWRTRQGETIWRLRSRRESEKY